MHRSASAGKGRGRLLAIATALPPFSGTQDAAWRFLRRVLEARLEGEARERAVAFGERIYARSGIVRRHSVLEDFACEDPGSFRFFPRNWRLEPLPGNAARMRLYEESGVELAVTAAQRALARAEVDPREVTHVVISSCTGFFAPGPDVHLVRRLGLDPRVERTLLGFMGCYAGVSGMRTAAALLDAEPRGVVLQVALELCTLHFRPAGEPDAIVANALFADGCAAAVYAGRERAPRGGYRFGAARSWVGEGLDAMTWRIGDAGFEMRLGAEVPSALARTAPAFVEELLNGGGSRDEVSWAIHPGGKRILEAVARALEVGEEALEASFDVLRRSGNMSSAAVLFVLERLLERGAAPRIAALAFGPGLTIEGAVLEREDV